MSFQPMRRALGLLAAAAARPSSTPTASASTTGRAASSLLGGCSTSAPAAAAVSAASPWGSWWPQPSARAFSSSSSSAPDPAGPAPHPRRRHPASPADPASARLAKAQDAAEAAADALRSDAATTSPPRRPRVFYASAWSAARELVAAAVRLPAVGRGGSKGRRGDIRAARGAAAALARATGGAFDGAALVHTPASLTLAVSALHWAGAAEEAAALVRQACADAAGGSDTGLPRPLGAGAAPPAPTPPPSTAALAGAASALARSGRADAAAALIEGALGVGAAMDEPAWAAVARFGGRAPGGVGARPARDLLATAVESGITLGEHAHTALVRAELDAGSLPNALAAADEAAGAGVDLHPSAWTALAARAAAHFGGPGRAAVVARADGVGLDPASPPPPSWVDLAAAAASLPPGRVPAAGLASGRRVRAMAYASSGED